MVECSKKVFIEIYVSTFSFEIVCYRFQINAYKKNFTIKNFKRER